MHIVGSHATYKLLQLTAQQRFRGQPTPIPQLDSAEAYHAYFETRYQELLDRTLSRQLSAHEEAELLALLEFDQHGLAELAYKQTQGLPMTRKERAQFQAALEQRRQEPVKCFPTFIPSDSVPFAPLTREQLSCWLKTPESIQTIPMGSGKVVTLQPQQEKVMLAHGLCGCNVVILHVQHADGRQSALMTHYSLGQTHHNLSKFRELVAQLPGNPKTDRYGLWICAGDAEKYYGVNTKAVQRHQAWRRFLEMGLSRLLKRPLTAQVLIYPELQDHGLNRRIDNVQQAVALVLKPGVDGSNGQLITSWGETVTLKQ